MKPQMFYVIMFYLSAYETPLITCKYRVQISSDGPENLSYIDFILFTSLFTFSFSFHTTHFVTTMYCNQLFLGCAIHFYG